jgi:hypothetical protein
MTSPFYRNERSKNVSIANVPRRWVLLAVSLAGLAATTASVSAAEENPWKYLLVRTLRDEKALANATLYVGDLTSRSLEPVAIFEPGFIVSSACASPTWDYALVTGHTYNTPGEVTRFYKVALNLGAERELIFEDGCRRHDDVVICPGLSGDVFYFYRSFSIRKTEEAEPRTYTILYRYAPETGIEQLAELEGYVALHGVAGENKFYVSYDEQRPEGRTTVFGYYDVATGELTDSGFEPPKRYWNPGDAPPPPPVPGEGPLSYTLGVVKCDSGYGIDYYFREPDDPDNYRNVKVEETTAGFVLCRDREVIVYIPELDVEENGIRIVTKYLDGTYGDPFPLPTDPNRGDLQEQRWEYQLLDVECAEP